ncbi:DUF4149 domain-containing protein [Kamptonema animale CS-326]|jgi:hypothetical protein|uniref:DUF4149 domain-containing protein n=1 Tax=Kamptonema animale TaxID=92934 RepID=UPI00232CEFC9|nr:DUF4149 domain-containing protein [Kamptonema animale]MDB9512728.1 DUF4149 domain-containing protein [Kamptonema animale CS-326]
MTAIYSKVELSKPRWQTIVIFTLAFWLSGSLILDLVIMPSLYVSGTINSSGFATAGNVMFSAFNRVELLCAALGMTGIMVLSNSSTDFGKGSRTAILLSFVLLAIALLDTYALTPQMTALGAHLNLFEPVVEVPSEMNLLHQSYFGLEAVKLAAGAMLLSWCYRHHA